MLRTVYLPNERADALIRAVSELHDRFEEFKLISTEQIQVQTYKPHTHPASSGSLHRHWCCTVAGCPVALPVLVLPV